MRIGLSVKHAGLIVLGFTVVAGTTWSGGAFGQGRVPSGEGLITQENLFSPTRRPWTPPPAPPPAKPQPPPAKPEPPPPQFVLYGVMIMGDERRALLKEPKLTGGKVEQLSLGAPVGPYKLISIETDRVMLEKDGASLTVTVEDPTRPKGQVLALPAAATPQPPQARQPPQPRATPPPAPPQPSVSQPEPQRSPAHTLADAFSQLGQQLRSRATAQPGQQAPTPPGQ